MNFLRSAISEGGDVSHKRLISLLMSVSLFIGSMVVYFKYEKLITETFKTTCLFVCVMSGVATIAQIVSLVKGTPAPPDGPTVTTTTTDISAQKTEIVETSPTTGQ